MNPHLRRADGQCMWTSPGGALTWGRTDLLSGCFPIGGVHTLHEHEVRSAGGLAGIFLFWAIGFAC